MSEIHPDFERLLAPFDPDILNTVENTTFGLWQDLTFAFFNDGWFRFSEQNRGEPRISEEWPLGRSFLDAVPAVLRQFFIEELSRCRTTGRPWEHEYDCSSPDAFRLMHQIVYPLENSKGFLVVNSLAIEKSLGNRPDEEVEAGSYIDLHGLVHQCVRCRRVQNLRSRNRWDWIRAMVASPLPRTSHGLCPICFDYYYPGARNLPLARLGGEPES